MSDSDELSTPANFPSDSEIEQRLRRVVREALQNNEDITINLARSRAESALGLDAGFFKDNEVWKKRSKDMINAAVEEPQSPEKREKSAPSAKLGITAGTKRKSDKAQAAKKRRKKSPVARLENVDGDDVFDEGNSEAKPSASHETKGSKVEPPPEHDDGNALSNPPGTEKVACQRETNGKPAEDDDESDLSSLIDDPPPKKKRQKKSSSPAERRSTSKSTSKSKQSTESTKAKAAGKELSPDEEEIKRLQSWLIKCGIRKVWARELAKYPTAKEKIRHLRKMLDEVGMTGRYSAEKAKQIKDARELKAELEAAKEFNQQWGQKGGDDGDDDDDDNDEEDGQEDVAQKEEPQPRRLPRGLIDFGDSGDDDSS